jgi:hypothetical protein
MAEPLRFHGQIPAPLLLVQPAQQQVHLAVVLTIAMLEARPTRCTDQAQLEQAVSRVSLEPGVSAVTWRVAPTGVTIDDDSASPLVPHGFTECRTVPLVTHRHDALGEQSEGGCRSRMT